MLNKDEGQEEYRSLKCGLTAKEVDERAAELAEKVAKVELLEQRKKDEAKRLKDEIDEVSNEVLVLAKEVRDRAAYRNTRCRWERNDHERTMSGDARPIRIASKSSTGFWYLNSFKRSFISPPPVQC